MSARSARGRMASRSDDHPSPATPPELLAAADTLPIHLLMALDPWWVRAGRPPHTIRGTEGGVLLRWQSIGAWIEVDAQRVSWFLVDPFGRVLPEEGEADRDDALMLMRRLVEGWGPSAERPSGQARVRNSAPAPSGAMSLAGMVKGLRPMSLEDIEQAIQAGAVYG